MRLLPGSPAIDAGDPNFDPATFTPPLTTDQRGLGFARVQNGRVDIGAVEVSYAFNASAGTPQSAQVNTMFSTALAATVLESGLPANGVSVSFTAPASGASATFIGGSTLATVLTDASGMATSPAPTANGITGAYSVVASYAGGASVQFGLTNTQAPAITSMDATTFVVGTAASFTVQASGFPAPALMRMVLCRTG